CENSITAGIFAGWNGVQGSVCAAAILTRACPLYPQKRTWFSTIVMSALCQKQTYTVRQILAYSIASSARAERAMSAHLLCVRRRLAAFSRSACWTAHLFTSEFTRFCSSAFSSGD